MFCWGTVDPFHGGKRPDPGPATCSVGVSHADERTRTMTWMVCYNSTAYWSLKMVDKLQEGMENCDQPGRGFFTLDEFLGKRHLKSETKSRAKRSCNATF